jgi:putative tryptophan/tyrosine transport system substrate-binding protein
MTITVARRKLLAALGGAMAAWPLAARAQQLAMPVVGFLSSGSKESDTVRLPAFWRGLNETGYVEGRNVASEYRWADDRYDSLSALAANLVNRA